MPTTFSFSLHCFPLASPTKSLKPILIHELPTLKRSNLGGLFFKRAVFAVGCAKVGSFPAKTMTEMVRIDDFRSRDASDDEFRETEAILRNGSSEFGADVRFKGWESALNRSSKWLVALLFSVVVLWKHDAEAMWAAVGSVMNSLISVVLKHLLNHQRPVSAPKSDPGMPSSHAQSIFYSTVFAILALIQWLGINVLSITLGAFALSCGTYLSWLRVSQRLHTVSQVSVGAILGSIFSIFWFWSWQAFVLKAFVSFLWVRIIVLVGVAITFLGFFVYVILFWHANDH